MRSVVECHREVLKQTETSRQLQSDNFGTSSPTDDDKNIFTRNFNMQVTFSGEKEGPTQTIEQARIGEKVKIEKLQVRPFDQKTPEYFKRQTTQKAQGDFSEQVKIEDKMPRPISIVHNKKPKQNPEQISEAFATSTMQEALSIKLVAEPRRDIWYSPDNVEVIHKYYRNKPFRQIFSQLNQVNKQIQVQRHPRVKN